LQVLLQLPVCEVCCHGEGVTWLG